MLKRILLFAAVIIVLYLLAQTYQLTDLQNLQQERQALELKIVNSDDPAELRSMATTTLHQYFDARAEQSEQAFRRMFMLVGLLVCLLPLFFLPGSMKYTFRKKSGGKGERNR